MRQASGQLTRVFFSIEAAKVRARVGNLLGSNLPLGWRPGTMGPGLWGILSKVFGILLTALLISFGAPFWNDVLKSLLGVKGFLKERKAKPVES